MNPCWSVLSPASPTAPRGPNPRAFAHINPSGTFLDVLLTLDLLRNLDLKLRFLEVSGAGRP